MSDAGLPEPRRSRPRVVVADDHSLIRQALETVLAPSCDVVAAVDNGQKAVDAVRDLDPDVVVLDITMPILDGFGAARELARRGTRAKILFVTVHESTAYVAAAVATGVQGYVAKSRLSTDLPSAITHVLEGRLRLPTSSSLLGIADPRARHAVQFPANDDARLDELSRFAATALRRGDVAVAVGGPEMLSGVTSRLRDARLDLASIGGRFQTVDAEALLSEIMPGEADEMSISDIVDRLERARAAAGGESAGLVVFGELADLLIRDGNIRGGLALERAWHSHPGTSRIHTLCSYNRASLEGNGRREVFDHVCAAHLAVSP
jgi:DNA-binding NarL/FixJ family response regulator